MTLLQGAGWTVAWRLTARIIGLGSVLVLARLLTPESFGLVALAAGFAAMVDALTTMGSDDALVRAETPSRALLDTVFTLNLLRAAATAGLLAAMAWPAAAMLGDSRLLPVLLVLAGSTLAEGLVNPGVVLFRRDMRFDQEFRLALWPRLASAVVTLGCAVVWRDHWALIAGVLSNRLLRVAMGYAVHPYRPRLGLAARGEVLGYSLWAWGIAVLVQLRERAEVLLVGRAFGPAAAGLYDTGREIALLPATEFVAPACRAAFSGFARERRGGAVAAGDAMVRVLALLAPLALPAGVGLALLAAPLVRLLLGPAWAEAVPVVHAMGMAGAAAVFGTVASTQLMVQGEMRLSMRVNLAALPVRVALLLALLPHAGLAGIALAMALVTVAGRIAMLWLAMRRFGVGPGELAGAVGRAVVATAVMAGVVLLGVGARAWPEDAWQAAGTLLLGGGIGAAAYAGVLLALWRLAGRPDGFERAALSRLGGWRRRIGGG